jgi:hypothetical protein
LILEIFPYRRIGAVSYLVSGFHSSYMILLDVYVRKFTLSTNTSLHYRRRQLLFKIY